METSNIIIFGASRLGKLAKEYLEISCKVVAFCDNNINKHNTIFEGIEVISPEKLKNYCEKKNILIVIASMYYREITDQLLEMRIHKDDIKIFENRINSYDYNFNNKLELSLDLEKYKIEPKITKKHNVHLMIDNVYCNTFIETVNRSFDESNNIFIIYNTEIALKYIDNKKYNNIYIFNMYKQAGDIFLKLLNCEKLFIHYFDDCLSEFLYKYNITKIVEKSYWILWGGDFYPYLKIDQFEPQTQHLMNSMNLDLKDIKINKYKEKMIEQIDYFLTITEGDFELLKKQFKLNGNLKWFTYYINIKSDLLSKMRKQKNNNCLKDQIGVEKIIWLGNSATYENNHLDIMNKLKEIDNKKFAIICPLAYGDELYKKKIIEIGKEIFNERFFPLESFMEGQEYFRLMNEADVIIMNHIRQQGFGNILGALYLGKKVYMNPRSTLYKSYIEKNIKIFKSDNIGSYEDLVEEKFDKDMNISILKENINNRIIEDNIINLLSE